MKRVKTIARPVLKDAACSTGCGECQTSCQSACKTSCGVANQKCEKEDKQDFAKSKAAVFTEGSFFMT